MSTAKNILSSLLKPIGTEFYVTRFGALPVLPIGTNRPTAQALPIGTNRPTAQALPIGTNRPTAQALPIGTNRPTVAVHIYCVLEF